MIGLFVVVVYAISAWYVLKQLPSRRAKTIVWAIIVLTWGPALIVAFVPPFSFQPEAASPFVGKFVEMLLVVGLSLMPLAALGFGIARWATAPQSKNIVVGTTVFLGFFMLFADEVVGRTYFYSLCTMEGGQNIYKTVEIDKEYYGPTASKARLSEGQEWEVGKEYILHVEGDHPTVKRTVRFVPDSEKLKDRYEILIAKFADQKVVNVQKIFSLVKDRQSGEILGTATSFAYWGGWVVNNSGMHVTAVECPRTKMNPYEPSSHSTLLEKVFKPAKRY